MKYIKEYIEETCFLHPMGEVTLQQNEDSAGWSGVNVCVNGVETPLFIAHADYAEWLESKLDNLKDKKDEKPAEKTEEKSEQKPEPRFKIGDWVVQRDGSRFAIGEKFAQITNIDDDGLYGLYWLDCRTWVTGREIRLWNIRDAKDGDVLVSPRQIGSEKEEDIFIFKCIGNRDYVYDCIEYYCNIDEGEFFVNKTSYMGTTSSPLYPATKEQRDLLFKKMKKAGYKWDNEKKMVVRLP